MVVAKGPFPNHAHGRQEGTPSLRLGPHLPPALTSPPS